MWLCKGSGLAEARPDNEGQLEVRSKKGSKTKKGKTITIAFVANAQEPPPPKPPIIELTSVYEASTNSSYDELTSTSIAMEMTIITGYKD